MTNEATARPLRAPEAIEQALTLHQRGRFDEAAQIYDAVLAADPDNFDALHLCGVLQHQQGRSVEGLRLVAAALKAQPGAADALINYGVILEALKRHQEALAAFDEALASRAESASAHYNRGRTLASLGRHAEALASYEKAIALAPSHIEARLNRGNALAALGRRQEALDEYDAVLASLPAARGAQARRGNALIALKRHQEALAAYDAVLALVPGDAEALNNRGVALTELGRCEEALQSCERAIAHTARLRRRALQQGQRFARTSCGLRRHVQAIGRRLRSSRGARCAEQSRTGIAWSEKARGGAWRNSKPRWRSMPDHLETQQNHANALLRLDRFEEALAACDKCLAQEPGQPDVLNTRGVVLGKLGRHAEALAELRCGIGGQGLAPTSKSIAAPHCSISIASKRHLPASTR